MRLILTALLCLIPVSAHAQAFGAYKGMTIDEYPAATQSFGRYWYVEPPTPNQNFVLYEATVLEGIGTCEIQGETVGVEEGLIDAKAFGLLFALMDRYGAPDLNNETGWAWYPDEAELASVSLYKSSGRVLLKYSFDCEWPSAFDTTGL